MSEDLIDFLVPLIQKSKYGEIELRGDFQHEDIQELVDKFDELNLVGVTLDRSCGGCGVLKIVFRGFFI